MVGGRRGGTPHCAEGGEHGASLSGRRDGIRGGAPLIVATDDVATVPDERGERVGLLIDEGHQRTCDESTTALLWRSTTLAFSGWSSDVIQIATGPLIPCGTTHWLIGRERENGMPPRGRHRVEMVDSKSSAQGSRRDVDSGA